MECHLGYFTFDSTDSIKETIEEFQAKPLETPAGKALVTANQFKQLQQKVEALQQFK